MQNLHSQYLQAMGIQQWIAREKSATPEPEPIALQPVITASTQTSPIANMDWKTLKQCVGQCTACSLHKTRTQTVFGVGNQQAQLMLIGEAPGATEDKLGQPFVGRAGQLLDEMLKAIGLQREQIYIANILKCRPPNNRDPKAEEVAQCTPFLERQVALIKPKLILALGRIAAHFLLKSTASLASLRSRQFHFGTTDIPLIITYHPAYLLRSPREKRKAYEDLQTVLQLL